MKCIFNLILILLITDTLSSQNLVRNSSFEEKDGKICDNVFIKQDSLINKIINSYTSIADWKLISPTSLYYKSSYHNIRFYFYPNEMNIPFIDTCFVNILNQNNNKAKLEIKPHSGSCYIRN